jgi:hypothetical protein
MTRTVAKTRVQRSMKEKQRTNLKQRLAALIKSDYDYTRPRQTQEVGSRLAANGGRHIRGM